jgi:glycosyltransferase involved in cell wall biosynthesis
VTLLVNAQGERAFSGDVHRVRSYRAGDSSLTRLLAMSSAAVAPRLVARDVPRDLDVIHLPLTVPIPKTSVPTVITVHDLQHLELPEFFSRGELLFRRWAYEGAARWATHVITPSEYAKGELVSRLGLAPEKITAIPHGIDAERFQDASRDEELLAGYDLPERFLYYGANAWPHKNHARLIEALGRASDMDIELVLTGNPHGREAEFRAADRVMHLGFVPADVVPALMRRSEGLIFPSLYEGFGFPPLEAMAAGRPVISSTRGALAENVEGAVVEIDPEEVDSIAAAIDAVAAGDAILEQLRSEAAARAARYSWRTSAERHRAVYEGAAKG